jgi:hypothetical protein
VCHAIVRIGASLLGPLIAPAPTARYEVRVQVLSSLSQSVRGVGVGPAVGGQFNTLIPCSQPYPTDTIRPQESGVDGPLYPRYAFG